MPSVELPPFGPISDVEVAWACGVMGLPRDAFSGKDGADPRLAVMRSLETLDIEACPGSGKTTLLVAKLAILANRWKSRRQGICVLSHTNAARSEIGNRLSSTSAGHLLLRHPHFVGTIHSFVNEFLAIPWLRSMGRPIRAIDNELAWRNRWYRLPQGTRTYLEKNHDGRSSLEYALPDFTGSGMARYPRDKTTYQNMVTVCQQSTKDGYYCYDEMFVWASELLDRCPDVIGTIRRRFPLVFIDEVQDNSELQSALLQRIFIAEEAPVIRQRLGDSNQAIFHRAGASGAVSDAFPGSAKVDLPNSFRFGQVVADVVAPLGLRPQALVGMGPTKSRVDHAGCQSALFLFDDASVQRVLPAYAKYLIKSFSDDALARGHFTAVAATHRAGDRDDHLPRFMGHYAPEYAADVAGAQPKPSSLAQYLARARLELAESRNTYSIARWWAEGILHLVRLVGEEVPPPLRKGANRYLLERLTDEQARRRHLALLVRLIDCQCEPSEAEWETEVAPSALAVAQAVVGQQVSVSGQQVLDFLRMRPSVTASRSIEIAARKPTNLFRYPAAEPVVSVRLGSIHSVKGETHTATLVLESYRSAHHLKSLLRWLLGKKPKAGSDNTGEDAAAKERLKLHYVAMTRPSHLLCLAMRKDTFKAVEIDLMRARNWRVIDCVADEEGAHTCTCASPSSDPSPKRRSSRVT